MYVSGRSVAVLFPLRAASRGRKKAEKSNHGGEGPDNRAREPTESSSLTNSPPVLIYLSRCRAKVASPTKYAGDKAIEIHERVSILESISIVLALWKIRAFCCDVVGFDSGEMD